MARRYKCPWCKVEMDLMGEGYYLCPKCRGKQHEDALVELGAEKIEIKQEDREAVFAAIPTDIYNKYILPKEGGDRKKVKV